MVDCSQNISTPINATGTRVEYTDMTFINYGTSTYNSDAGSTTIDQAWQYSLTYGELKLASKGGCDP